MYGHVVMLMHKYPFSPTRHLHLGWYPYRIGYGSWGFQTFVWSFPSSWWMHQSYSSRLSFRDHHFDLLRFTSPISPIISRSSRPWSTCIIHCSQLLTIWSSMPLKFIVVTHIVWSRTSLWSRTRLNSGFRPAHRLLIRVVQHPFVIHIPLFFHLRLPSSRTNFNLLFGLYKLHFFGDIARWTTSSGISQPRLVWELFLRWNDII